jgi:anti-anti-sigma factor
VPEPASQWRLAARAEIKEDSTLLFLEGRIGYATLAAFESAVREALARHGLQLLILDLAGVDYVNGGGLRAIIAAGAAARTAGARVVVRGARDAVRVTLGLADFRKRPRR